jgi:hypothetical protein
VTGVPGIAISEKWVRVGVATLPTLGLIGLAWAVVLLRFELPDPVAIHFDLTGGPEDSFDRNLFFWLLLNAATLGVIVGVVASWRARGRTVLSGWASVATFVSWLATGIGAWTLVGQRGLESWTDARGPGPGTLLALVAVPAVGAAVSGAVALRLPTPPLSWDSAPRMGLGPQEDAVWTQRVIAPWFALLVMSGLGLVAVGWIAGFGILVWIGGVLTLVGVQMRSVRVTTDKRGLTMSWGPLGVPRHTLPLARIAQATAIDVRPREWGGWGYRGSVALFGTAGAILRSGPGLRLDLVDGRVFVVTVDDPEIGAGLLNDYVRRTAADPAADDH